MIQLPLAVFPAILFGRTFSLATIQRKSTKKKDLRF